MTSYPHNSMRQGKTLVAAALCTALCTVIGSMAHAQSVTRSEWQMYIADQVHYEPEGTERPKEGELQPFKYAKIPPLAPKKGERQWVTPPDRETINYLGVNQDGVSRIINDPIHCLRAFDYAYFQTVVKVEKGAKVDTFQIDFKGMDDASRITIFNKKYPKGTPDMPEGVNNFVWINQSASMDLARFLTEGDNRVVITQVDHCPAGNRFESAQVTLNGKAVTAKPGPFETVGFGDLHVRTRDQISYDFHVPGDFWNLQMADGGFNMQIRTAPMPTKPHVSVATAMAAFVSGDVVEIYNSDGAVFINGVPQDMSGLQKTTKAPMKINLPQGGVLTAQTRPRFIEYFVYRYPEDHPMFSAKTSHALRYEVWPTQANVALRGAAESLNIGGLSGIEDGSKANDFTTREGEVIPRPLSQREINRFGESWRVRADESLFKARPPVEAVTKPPAPVVLAKLPEADRIAAATACLKAGVTEVNLLRDCTYDVAVTGDETFVHSTAVVHETRAIALRENPNAMKQESATGANPVREIGREALDTAEAATGVKATREKLPNEAKAEKADQPKNADKADKAEKADKPKKADKAGKAEKADKADKVEKADKADKVEKVEAWKITTHLTRGQRYEQNGHYVLWQEDGNLCVYTAENDRYVWCVNDDPNVKFQTTVAVGLTPGGQLVGENAKGKRVFAFPAKPSGKTSDVIVTSSGALQVFNEDGVSWSSK